MPSMPPVSITIDRGGTFCDVWAHTADGKEIVFKLLSVDPASYPDAPTEGIRRVLEQLSGQPIPKGQPIDGSLIESVRIGTTVATNALLERKGERFALLTTEGFRDICRIGDQTRPDLFDLNIRKPGVLYSKVIEIAERVTVEDYVLNPHPAEIDLSDPDLVKTSSGEVIRILKRLDSSAVREQLRHLYDEGFRSLAIGFIHSYLFPDHEQAVARIAREIGFEHVSLSSELSPNIKILHRTTSACADAYLSPTVKKYVDGFISGFSILPKRVDFMQSDGGLSAASKFTGLKAILSGPAGGVVAIARTCYDPSEGTPVVGFDMGGTSTDISRFDKMFEHVFNTTISGTTITTPMLDVKTVAAGGGSILSWKNGLFVVGPESAGAHPGPASYRKGGPLTITDANLFLGRLVPEKFPSYFGPHANEPLDVDVVKQKFHELTAEINANLENKLTPEDVASGFLAMANETMSRPIRNITEARGFAISKHNLASFGGAGGQHACAIARILGMPRIIIHKYSSILSAYGIGLADIVSETAVPAAYAFSEEVLGTVLASFEELKAQTTAELIAQGVQSELVDHECYLSMRYEGSDTNLSILQPQDNDFGTAFVEAHRREFAFEMAKRPIVVDAIRVRGVGKSREEAVSRPSIFQELQNIGDGVFPETTATKHVFIDGSWQDVPVYELASLSPKSTFTGPALVIDNTQTILVETGCRVSVLDSHLVIDLASKETAGLDADSAINPVELSTFASRFMSIAEQMGNTLQRTSISTSIKERLDFSCALFTPDGKLVANAPHIPIHLGSMQFAIQHQHSLWAGKLQPGDVLLTNHPDCGGTHLPDLTVVTPVFASGELIFYVASRGHHTDIGGIGITSMVPDSKFLWQEGLAVKSLRIVHRGVFDEQTVRKAFLDVVSYGPGCSVTRRLDDNISDLKAQIAANQRGITLLHSMCAEAGIPRVQKYMYAIQRTAEHAVRALLRRIAAKHQPASSPPSAPVLLTATDFYDDGTPLTLHLTIHPATGSATFDFTAPTTGSQTLGNMNCPPSITHSAIIYTLRTLLTPTTTTSSSPTTSSSSSLSIPLNQGALAPITIRLRPGSILSPTSPLAICGSTISSQRVVDVILRALGICAASQGCANSFGWGAGGLDPVTGTVAPGWNYGEALGGGSGAGEGWAGADAVQVHSTNTQTTDVEVVERRTPVVVRRWGVRVGSAGRGRWRGGEGVVREVEARVGGLRFSILSERRVYSPYGMGGGGDGGVGRNYWVRRGQDGGEEWVSLGGKAVVDVAAGERVVVCTPGGGGWGTPLEGAADPGDVRPLPTQ
ncbi:5-oxoprolinase (atp-hydrolyzing) [Diplodia corticola]|uniref:5-oxoprolinase (Atp-hydrolysing) n=1 Tax=Diplodia corticola TaxID=236234 RepID=A0A1J9R8U1_9PEZI|nr:5-oxoprolinase (atp-hydrolyzing) [Diplodia corticola]OJD28827.1 5-oxoprolinase (atp-hydrolysing) [Diplodia corticola]